jgi:hypothetical protein
MSTFQMERQSKDKWCWAAVSASIERHFLPNSTWTQCRVARSLAAKKKLTDISGIAIPVNANCCGDPDVCNQAAGLDDALRAVGRLKSFVSRPLTFTEVRSEIDDNCPVGVRIGWPDRGGHFVAIHGYYESSNSQVVHVSDPQFGPSSLYYEHFKSCYQFWNDGGGFWTDSYLIQG